MAELFVKLDCHYLDNEKMLQVSETAELLYLRMLTVSKRLMSDGRIVTGHLRRYGPTGGPNGGPDAALDAAHELEQVGLWEKEGEGAWLIAGWMERNASSDEIDTRSAEGRENALKRWHRLGKHETEARDGCPLCTPDGVPSGGPSGVAVDPPLQETETETETETEPTTSDLPSDPDVSDEARTLTRQFAVAVKNNGHSIPSAGSKARNDWLIAMDRLLRLGPPGEGGHVPTADEVGQVIAWCAADTGSGSYPGESVTVRSVPKFRERYSELRRKAGFGANGHRGDPASSRFFGGVPSE